MKMEHPKEVVEFTLQAILIGMINFVFPLWVATGINWGALLVKVYQWFTLDITFWENKSFMLVVILVIIAPIAYLFWFYYLTFKKLAIRIHATLIKPILRELANAVSKMIINWYDGKADGANNDEVQVVVEKILAWINNKVEQWPLIPRWLTKKILARIPFLDLLMQYHDASFTAADQTRLSDGLFQKLDDIVSNTIQEIVPAQMKFIIPVNLAILFILWYL